MPTDDFMDAPSVESDTDSIPPVVAEYPPPEQAPANPNFVERLAEPAPTAGLTLPNAPTEAQLHEIDEVLALPLAGEPGAPARRLPAMRHANFRLFWFGNLLSLIGTMAQQSAQLWLLRKLTDDPGTIAFVTACSTLPILLLTVFTGAVADRVDKRRTLIVTNSFAALLALILTLLVAADAVQIWQVALITLGVGVVNAFDIPVRQSFNIEMVGRDDLPNAIALNSSAFNTARVAGPAVGGFLLAHFGMAQCFFLNALSFVAIIVGLSLMRMAAVPRTPGTIDLAELREGWRFVRGHPILQPVMVLVAFVSVTALPYANMLSVFAKDVFGTDERGYSVLMTCQGLGALGSTIALAAATTMRHKGKRLLLGSFLFCWAIVGFATSTTLPWACFFLIVQGWFLLTFLMTANTLVQTLSPDLLRGRVFALYSLSLVGTAPVGSVLVGLLARVMGPAHAVQLGGAVGALYTAAVFFRCRRLWKEK